jgi:hypothetical protein
MRRLEFFSGPGVGVLAPRGLRAQQQHSVKRVGVFVNVEETDADTQAPPVSIGELLQDETRRCCTTTLTHSEPRRTPHG